MRALALLLLCGCDALFGLDHVPLPDDASVDSSTRAIHCDYEWHVVGTDPTGLPAASTQAAPASYAHAVADGIPVPISADGTFQFTARSALPYELAFEVGGSTSYYDRDTDTCHLVTTIFHRLGATPATQSTPVRFDITGTPPTSAIVRITSTGQRTYLTPTFSMTNSWSVDWLGASELDSTRAGLLDANAGDRLFWIEMALSTDFYSIAQAAQASVTLTNGSPAAVVAAASAVPQRCINIATAEGTIAQALQAAAPRGPGVALSSWAITSSNAPDDGLGENQPLAVTRRADVTDHTAKVAYGNPYGGESDLFQVGVAITHSVTVGTATPLAIYSSLSYYDRITADSTCTVTVTQPASPITFPRGATIAGALLAADNQAFALDRSQPVPVHVDVDPGTELVVFLQELSAKNGATTATPIAQYLPFAADFTIDPALLAVGHTYILYLETRHGFPGAHVFDYRTVEWPAVDAAFPTTSFTITR